MTKKGEIRGPSISDITLWEKEFLTQFNNIKGALHSLRLQIGEQKVKNAKSKSLERMRHTFEMAEIAFQAMNTPEPRSDSNTDELIPAPGRRQFLQDLRHGEVRT